MDIAIIGMSGRFPGAKTIEAFGENLSKGVDSVKPISKERIRATTIEDLDYQLLGTLDDIDKFDHSLFNLSLGEAENMDPHQRILLEVIYSTIENSGYSIDFFDGSDTSLYIGDKRLDYYRHVSKFDPTVFTGNLSAMVAAHAARFFNFRGSAVMIDTTCSSSLVALHYACNDLILGHADHSVVCGISISLFPHLKNNTIDIGVVSPDGKSKAFSEGANGIGGGEAAVCVLLKPLEKALADKDVIHAIIKGTAVNQDARLSPSVAAPNSITQSEVIKLAWQRAKIDPNTISFIEAHGTGTKLGDPVEVEGLNLAFRSFTERNHFCAISTVKSNVGHTDCAAGLVGLVKTVLSLKQKKLFPSLHCMPPSPFIDFDHSAVYVNKELKDWSTEKDAIRRAGVSSFGLSGTNVHVVLEEYKDERQASPQHQNLPVLIMISALSRKSLMANMKAYENYLSMHAQASLEEIGFTLACGRKHYDHRFACVASSKEDLLGSLKSFKNTSDLAFQSENKFFFILSDSLHLSEEQVVSYIEKYTVFRLAYEECQAFFGKGNPSAHILQFVFQYSFYKLVESYGVKCKFLLGDGIGKIVIAVFAGKISLSDACEQVVHYKPASDSNLSTRTASLLEKEKNRQIVFCELGPVGNVSNELLKHTEEYKNCRVITLQESLEDYLKDLYLLNYKFDWNLYKSTQTVHKKIELPTYQFTKTRCWVNHKADIDSFFYDTKWIASDEVFNSEDNVGSKIFLVICDAEGLADNLETQLKKHQGNCIKVYLKDTYKKCSTTEYEINVAAEWDYEKLKASLITDNYEIDGIINLVGYRPFNQPRAKEAERMVDLFSSHFFIRKVFFDSINKVGFSLVAVTCYGEKVSPHLVLPDNTMAIGFYKGILSDSPLLKVRTIDFDFSNTHLLEKSEIIVKELFFDSQTKFVAYREFKRMVPLVKRTFPLTSDDHEIHIKQNGVYLVTGGVGEIAFEVCKSIAESKSHLVIIGRTEIPAEYLWADYLADGQDNRISQIIKKLLELEALGATVEYYSLDVSNPDETEDFFYSLNKKLTKINGVLHAAGIRFSGTALQHKDINEIKTALSVKLNGTLVLNQYTKIFNPDFHVLFSSLNAIVPQKNSAEYAAANAFLDGYAVLMNSSGETYIAINWPAWQKNSNQEEDDKRILKAISYDQGADAFHYALKLNRANVAVAKIALNKFALNPFFLTDADLTSSKEQESKLIEPVTLDSKRVHDTFNITEIEKIVSAIWFDVLKSKVKAHDNFFEIGGHSLNGSQVLNRISKEFDLKMEIENLFQYPTVKLLAEFIYSQSVNENHTLFSAITPVANSAYYEVSHAQKRLWILDQIQGGTPAYNMPGAFCFDGRLNKKCIEQSLAVIIERHEILRTTFKVIDGEVKQIVHEADSYSFKIAYEDFSGVSDQDEQVKIQMDLEANRLFDLENGPLLRIILFKLAPDKHIFLFTMHHIVSDGWSMKIFYDEFISLYNSFVNAARIELKPLSIQYKDYAAWQNRELSGEQLISHKDYWFKQFNGQAPVLTMDTDYPRPLVKTYSGSQLSFELDQSIVNAIKKYSQSQGVSLFMTLLASVKALLFKYTENTDIVIGTPAAGRNHTDIEDQLGFYVNTLALRSVFSKENSFTELVSIVKKTTLLAYEHQVYPFDRLIDDLNLLRDMSRSPLFDVMVVLHNVDIKDRSSREIQNISIQPISVDFKISKYDLTFNFIEQSGGLIATIEYNTDLFSLSRIEQLIVHYKQLIEGLMNEADLSLKEIEYIGEDEKNRLVKQFNATSKDREYRNLIDVFEDQVEKNPDAVALRFEHISVTYNELNERANQLAHHMVENYQVKTDDLVGIVLDKSERSLIAILGIMKSGAGYLPIDPAFPEERRQLIIQDSKIQLILSEAPYINECSTGLIIDVNNPQFSTYPVSNLKLKRNKSDLIYALYTSGSTGKPKGVVVEHAAVMNLFFWLNDLIYNRHSVPLVAMLTASIHFDASVQQLFPPLLSGGSLVIIKDEVKKDPDLYVKQLIEYRVHVIDITPAFLKVIIPYLVTYKNDLHLQYILVGGEVLGTDIRSFFASGEVTYKLINVYGITEVTVNSTFETVTANAANRTSIGRPIDNTEVYILDSNQSLLPVGFAGEIYISGAGLARGYLNDAELTQQKYIAHPYKKNERLYRSGDLGKWLPDGTIDFLGRKDNQFKIRGYRIETDEIEYTLNQHDEVLDSIVTVSTDKEGVKELIGYVKTGLKESEIRNYLKSKLPEYMIPSQVIKVDSFPLTSSGKVDRLALLNKGLKETRDSVYLAATNILEQQLVGIWEEVLGREPIGITDNFFDIGGHSLKAIQVVSRIQKQTGLTVQLRDVFSNPTISSLADCLSNVEVKEYKQIEPIVPMQHYDVSHAQQRLWILHQMSDDEITYNIPGGFQFEGKLDKEALLQSFMAVIARHEILRTTFRMINGELKQLVHDSKVLNITLDYESIAAVENKELLLKSLAKTQTEFCFDLEKGPLLRALLIEIEEEKFAVLLTMHHIISDAWSIKIFQDEIIRFYNSYVSAAQPDLLPLRIQYKDYAHWQNQQLKGEQLEKHRTYWINQFRRDIPVLSLDTDYPRPVIKRNRGSRVHFVLDKDIAFNLKKYAESQGATFFMALFASVKVLLYKYSSDTDIIAGTTVASRDHLDVEDQIGFYVNTLALRSVFLGSDTFEEFLATVKQNVLQAYDHQLYPFDKLINDLELPRDISRSPLFDVLIELVSIDLSQIEAKQLKGINVSQYAMEHAVSKYDLSFRFMETETSLMVMLEYETDLFTSQRIEQMASHWKQLIDAILADPKVSLQAIEYLSSDEKEQIIGYGKNTYDTLPQNNVVTLFERQAERNPDRIALQFAGKSTSYKSLNEASNKLAHHLIQSLNVQIGQSIGIMMDRSEHMMISILGVLKAGGVFVPIDPSYPGGKINHMLTDSGVSVLLTESRLMLDVIEYYPGKLFALDIQLDSLDEHASNLNLKISLTDNAYIIYTSGTTGHSKGVPISHNSLSNYAVWANDYYFNNQQNNTFAFFTSLSFDLTLTSIFTTLLRGDEIYVYEEKEVSAILVDIFKSDSAVNTVKLTPSHINLLSHLGIIETSIKTVIVGGEALLKDQVEVLKRMNASIKIYNEYGPTEATIGCSVKAVISEDDITIGKPIWNTKLYILSPSMQLLPMGSKGELYIGGACLSSGYLKQPDLTELKFIANPFEAGGIIYKTGDIAKWLTNGDITYLGRNDEQVKIRGYRIELLEVESVLNRVENIKAAAVVVEYRNGEGDLHAYIVLENEINISELRAALSVDLPHYMIPVEFHILTDLPLTQNGKLDRKALSQRKGLSLTDKNVYVAPQTELQKALAEIWGTVLGKDKVSIHDNFFEIGGNSLRAVQIAMRIYKELNKKIDLKEIFVASSIYKLSALMSDDKDVFLEKIQPVAQQEYYPVSHAQKRFWILNQLNNKQTAYTISLAYYLEGELNIELFKEAFDLVIGRHEILRTRFATIGGQPKQEIFPMSNDFTLHYLDLNGKPDAIQEAYKIANDEMQLSFALDTAPLFNARLLRLEPQSHMFVFNIHHIIFDGWSMEIFIKEVSSLYNAFLKKQPNPLTMLEIQYKDYVSWEQQQLAQENISGHKQYWLSKLGGEISFLELPFDKSRSTKTYNGALLELMIDHKTKERLADLSKTMEVTLFMTIVAAVKTLLYRYTGHTDIILGTAFSNRLHPELENQMGLYLNTIPLRTEVKATSNFEYLLSEVKQTVLEAIEHQVYPLDLIIDDLELENSYDRSTLFDIMIDLTNIELNTSLDAGIEGIKVSGVKRNYTNSKFDLSFFFHHSTDGIKVILEYNTDLFSSIRMNRMLEHFKNIIQNILDNSKTPLNKLDYLSQEEKEQLTGNFNNRQ